MESLNLENRDIYVVLFDVDISWCSVFLNKYKTNKNTDIVYNKPALAFSLTERDAENYSDKITLLVKNRGTLPSTVRNNCASCSVYGNIIFTITFNSAPKINHAGNLSRSQLSELLTVSNSKIVNNYDVISYNPTWNNSGTRYFFTTSAYSKLTLNHIKFTKTHDITEHMAFCLYNAFDIGIKNIELLRELISNVGGKTYSRNVNHNPNHIVISGIADTNDRITDNYNYDTNTDPYREKYIKIKKHYLTELSKKTHTVLTPNLVQ